MLFNSYPIRWYAQSSSMFYSAKKIENLSDKLGSIAKDNEEFKSDEYLNIKNLNQKGIYRYGVTNDIIAKEQFVDFYFEDNREDFHFKTFNGDWIYGLYLTFRYKDTTKSKQIQWKTFGHFSKCLTLSKTQKRQSEIKINDIFVYKFGHADISMNNTQSFTHDGYSVGFKALLIIDELKTVELCLRGNLSFDDNKLTFHVIVKPNFNCTCYIELHTDDIEYINTKVQEDLTKNQQKLICIDHSKSNQDFEEDVDCDKEQIKKDYKEIARFIDWSEVPRHLKIDWDNDDIETIGHKLLKWESHIKFKLNCKPDTKYFGFFNQRGIILYHNDNFYDYICIPVFIDNECYNLASGKVTYIIEEENIVLVSGTIKNISYLLTLTGYSDKLPTINIKITTRDKVNIGVDIASALPFKFRQEQNKTFILDNSTLEITTTD